MLDLEQPAPGEREGAGHIIFIGEQLLLDLRGPRPPVHDAALVRQHGWEVKREQFVGHWQGEPLFAMEVEAAAGLDEMRFQLGSLYHLIGRVDDGLFAAVGRAAQLLDWERDHRYCGRCGGPMALAGTERAMACASCGTMLYPRIAPCVITLVTDGELMLLARSARFRRPMFSTLAGFIEAGESAEDTLRREVREEVGVDVGELRYFGSQPWPFPSQLMLGFFAKYAGGDIRVQPSEIAEADWYHPRDLPPVPPSASIAGRLIETHCRRVLA
jgi:NAD+ diphosphatase